jgi:hypothetical protein
VNAIGPTFSPRTEFDRLVDARADHIRAQIERAHAALAEPHELDLLHHVLRSTLRLRDEPRSR